MSKPWQSDVLVGFNGTGTKVRVGQLLDIVCLNCGGTAKVKCPNGVCSGGKIITTEPARKAWNGKQIVIIAPKRHIDTCPTCKGKTFLRCWSCNNGSQELR